MSDKDARAVAAALHRKMPGAAFGMKDNSIILWEAICLQVSEAVKPMKRNDFLRLCEGR